MKEFKKIFFVVVALSYFSISGISQNNGSKYGADSMQCLSNLSTMSEFVKIKVYEYAYSPWVYCFQNCPAASKNIYIQGEDIIEYKIEKAETDEIKEAYIDTLMLLYDQRIEYFGEEAKVLGKKGIKLLTFRREAVEEAYDILKKATEIGKTDVDEAVAATFITTSAVLFRNGVVGADVMISNYVMAMEYLEGQRPSRKLTQAIESIEKTFSESGAADCDALIAIFTPKYEENKQDVELLTKITELLKQTDCQKSDLFAQASESLFELEPSAKAGANLAIVFADRKDYEKAIEYYNKAIEIETDNSQKAKYYYQLAAIAMEKRNLIEVKQNCKQAISLDSGFGKAYILLGNAYAAASQDCGSTNFEKAAVFLVAADQFANAKSADPTVAAEAGNLIEKYSQYFPNNEDAFFEGFTDGQSYTVKCWINESTTIRTRKNN
ncbi:MAG: tetratricopeptide repeat protein [Bacteroidales bacterium]|nr:tetratricopeptide repeat protein [Bacteroidales bacterium]MBN2819468.1 tetratricopeptide repeat protein [Bacteroidales bacterium]